LELVWEEEVVPVFLPACKENVSASHMVNLEVLPALREQDSEEVVFEFEYAQWVELQVVVQSGLPANTNPCYQAYRIHLVHQREMAQTEFVQAFLVVDDFVTLSLPACKGS